MRNFSKIVASNCWWLNGVSLRASQLLWGLFVGGFDGVPVGELVGVRSAKLIFWSKFSQLWRGRDEGLVVVEVAVGCFFFGGGGSSWK